MSQLLSVEQSCEMNASTANCSSALLMKDLQPEGVADGLVEGVADGLVEGIADGLVEGVTDGLVEGVTDGLVDGSFDGAAVESFVGGSEGDGDGPDVVGADVV